MFFISIFAIVFHFQKKMTSPMEKVKPFNYTYNNFSDFSSFNNLQLILQN